MKIPLILLCALALIGLGVTSIFADTPNSSRAKSGQLVLPLASESLAAATSLEKNLSQEQLIQLLVRIGYLYGGFLCVLLALEFGTKRFDAEKPSHS